jgi:hypothetical protein
MTLAHRDQGATPVPAYSGGAWTILVWSDLECALVYYETTAAHQRALSIAYTSSNK